MGEGREKGREQGREEVTLLFVGELGRHLDRGRSLSKSILLIMIRLHIISDFDLKM